MDRVPKLLLAFLLMAVLLVAGCSNNNSSSGKSQANTVENQKDSTPKKGGNLTIAFDTDISNYDPLLGNSGNDHALLYPIYDTLVNFNAQLEPQPGLAESWDIPDDKTIILHLRKGVAFHDGTPFDAEAVKFNLERAISPDSKVTDLGNVESVEVVDAQTAKLNLKQPDSSIILALSDRSGMMVSPTAVQKFGEDFGQNPVGTGPYKLEKWVRNAEIQLKANENYWQEGLPYIDRMTLKVMPDENTRLNALKAGQVQLYWNVSPDNSQILKKDKNVVLNTKMKVAFQNMFINTKLAPLDKKEVRQALQYAIDREALVKVLTFGEGEPAYQTFPKEYWASNQDIKIPHDIEKAKSLLKEAGLESVSFDVYVPNLPFYQRIAEAVKGQVKEAGITMNIQTTEANKGNTIYFNEKQGQAWFTFWSGRPDPQQTMNSLISGKAFYNAGGESTPEKEELIARAAATYDQKERAQLYAQINEIAILEEAMTIPVFFAPATAAMSPKVKGFEGTLLGKPKFSFLWLDK
ncbi:ABC transporter substrate-binding protein [Mesobacillus campisalis]|uniref:ABC transporter substrate-binding protein n=1 Tax=Mesobacillus campisalis TaxID=1408103 RepID=A0A0M2SUM1_9BACI|nr:ABC transporter substrate-binding protein [Mesobacillus campisalis]KKK37396.1 ABC transporter substrate-binding protein [Mesobacillus campisalis]